MQFRRQRWGRLLWTFAARRRESRGRCRAALTAEWYACDDDGGAGSPHVFGACGQVGDREVQRAGPRDLTATHHPMRTAHTKRPRGTIPARVERSGMQCLACSSIEVRTDPIRHEKERFMRLGEV